MLKKYGKPIKAPTSEEITASEKKDGNDKLAKSEKSKKDDNDIKGVVKSLQGSTEIDKTVLQNLKDKIEKGMKKKE